MEVPPVAHLRDRGLFPFLHFGVRRERKPTRVYPCEDGGLGFCEGERYNALIECEERECGPWRVEKVLIRVIDVAAICDQRWFDVLEKREGVEVSGRKDDGINIRFERAVFKLDASV